MKDATSKEQVVDALFYWQPNHCETAYRNMIARSGLPAEYLQTIE